MKKSSVLLFISLMIGFSALVEAKPKWISLFNGKDLSGWFVRGKATWAVKDGILVGEGGMGHIYTDAVCTDFEAKGTFRVTDIGTKPNSGFYFRANPPEDKPDGFPRGYEAQICNSQDAYTGWLWKPGLVEDIGFLESTVKFLSTRRWRRRAAKPALQVPF